MAEIDLSPLGPTLGAVVRLPLDRIPSDGTVAALRSALLEHKLLVVRGQVPTPAQHLAFARLFGEIRDCPPHLPSRRDDGLPEIAVLDSEAGFRADSWHFDEPYTEDPPRGAVLLMRTPPPVGGDTIWVDVEAACLRLSEPVRAALRGLGARHASPDGRSAVHPVLRPHPLAPGRLGLFVCQAFTKEIVGVLPHESAGLLEALYRHLLHPDFQYRHRWETGDMVLFDGCATQHFAVFDYAGRRRTVDSVDIGLFWGEDGAAPSAGGDH